MCQSETRPRQPPTVRRLYFAESAVPLVHPIDRQIGGFLGRLWQSMTLLSQRMPVEDEPAYHQAIPKYPSKFFTFVLINDFQDTFA
jgi:hypothetical protein